jgi:hypothetical protein
MDELHNVCQAEQTDPGLADSLDQPGQELGRDRLAGNMRLHPRTSAAYPVVFVELFQLVVFHLGWVLVLDLAIVYCLCLLPSFCADLRYIIS